MNFSYADHVANYMREGYFWIQRLKKGGYLK